MGLFRRKKSDLYLSDRQPLTPLGMVGVGMTYCVLGIWTLAILWPLTQMIISAFNGAQIDYIIMGRDFEFSFEHFDYLFKETHYLKWLTNTILIAISSAVLTVVIVSFTGFAYSRYRFTGRKASLMAVMLIQTIPIFAGITAYFTMYSVINDLTELFTRQLMLVLIYSGGGIAGNTFILKGYLDSISTELDDAAKIDGCSNMKVYRLIIMPIARPMLSIIALWSFIGPFMDYLLAKVILTKVEQYTLAAGLYTMINDVRTLNQPAFAAGGLLTAVPIVIMFALLQNQLVSGLSKGSVKG